MPVLGKINYKVISDQNQNHMSKNDLVILKSSSKLLTCEVISNQNHSLVKLFQIKIKIFFFKSVVHIINIRLN